MTFARPTTRVRTRADKRAAAVNLVNFCTPERLAGLTAQAVADHSGCSLKVAEEVLMKRRGHQ